ncbi:hypothetical protein C2E21_4988 [Chlorella sorokiniana]|uniref:Uncharacterized protein n=1 Tax=Chlorella sorokiniana TaxID=3076 RepID=A0A2P6TPL2_CHLSO|nr:hypothetical protein C2E21_4988 [Chlorella sorokiniana]|eukprot:PRW55965.1 hypothetical protein C2E21_4988 [Chlorella sorokiniana]
MLGRLLLLCLLVATALPHARAQAEGGCIMAGQQVIGTCEDERSVIASVFPLSANEPVPAQQIDAAVAALKAAQGLPAQTCCTSVAPFMSAGCSSDPTLLSILPGVGIQPAGLNATLTALEEACGI